ncbi:hypothetical protein CDD83_5767 [Cordyceps sp. RAO-2017]|nr:hypothetical protein CDD83_5767 [Cordyceps sp. RAO-2017]
MHGFVAMRWPASDKIVAIRGRRGLRTSPPADAGRQRIVEGSRAGEEARGRTRTEAAGPVIAATAAAGCSTSYRLTGRTSTQQALNRAGQRSGRSQRQSSGRNGSGSGRSRGSSRGRSRGTEPSTARSGTRYLSSRLWYQPAVCGRGRGRRGGGSRGSGRGYSISGRLSFAPYLPLSYLPCPTCFVLDKAAAAPSDHLY